MTDLNLSIEGMSCDHCVAHVRRTLESTPGVTVEEVEVGRARVSLDEGAPAPDAVAARLAESGYPAHPR